MSVTAKSVVFDIADDWGGSENFIIVRRIEFFLGGTLISMSSGFTAYATSFYSSTYSPAYAFNTSLSKTGSINNTSWLSAASKNTNQRLTIVFDTPLEFDKIVVNNGHSDGSMTAEGAKNTKVTISSDVITDTTYNAAIANSSILWTGIIPQHIASNTADPQTIWEYIAPVTNNYRAILDQIYDLRPLLFIRTVLDQIYGLRMLATFNQYYGDAAKLRSGFDQRYGDAAKMRRKFDQLYGDIPKYRAALDQLYNLHAGLRAGLDQNYSIAAGQVRAALDQLADLQDKDVVRMTLDMLYVLAAGEALVQRFDIKVTCDGVEHSSMGNINIEQDGDSFFMAGELQLYERKESMQYKKFKSAVNITVDGWTCKLISGQVRESRQPGQEVFVVPLYSRTVLLDSPHSRLAAAELSGMASALVVSLAPGFTVSWQLVDWFIPPGRLAVNEGDTAISIIRRIVEAVGGQVQTLPDETLVCRPEYPVSVDQWDAVEPDYTLTDQDDFFQIDHAPELRDGYNKVNVSDQQLTSSGERIETVTLSPTKSEVRFYQVPWDDTCKINLRHSGNPSHVANVAGGVKLPTIEKEQVEIIGGSGQTSKPVYGVVSYYYGYAGLGAITVTEDGTVTTTEAANSLLYLTYKTKYWDNTVTDHNIEDVQFFPEVIDT